MKKTFKLLSLLAILSLAAFTKAANDTYTVDTEKSTVEWIGKKVTGQHTGTIKLSDGTLMFSGKDLKSGAFTMDMKTITPTDGSGDRLTGHLKAEDFFGVDKNPTSTFKITKVEKGTGDQVTVTGDLTIKGVSNPITFPATVKKQGNNVVAVAKGVKVDRTKYGIKFRSKNFFENLGNNMIDDDFELSVNLVAAKK